jgi:hypothetical protein
VEEYNFIEVIESKDGEIEKYDKLYLASKVQVKSEEPYWRQYVFVTFEKVKYIMESDEIFRLTLITFCSYVFSISTLNL